MKDVIVTIDVINIYFLSNYFKFLNMFKKFLIFCAGAAVGAYASKNEKVIAAVNAGKEKFEELCNCKK